MSRSDAALWKMLGSLVKYTSFVVTELQLQGMLL